MKKNPKKKSKPTKLKKLKGRIKTLQALPYRGCMIYIRRIDVTLFEYLVVFKEQIYSQSYEVILGKGSKDLSKEKVARAASWAMAGACTTVDYHLGTKLDKKTKEAVKAFEKARDKVLN